MRRTLPQDFLFFALGIVFGVSILFLAAYFADQIEVIAYVVLAAALAVALMGGLFALFREPILRRLYGSAHVGLEQLTMPIRDLAESAAKQDPEAAVAAAEQVARVVLARYAWISMRRWVLGVAIGLVAIFSGLAGSALLFNQNALIQKDIELAEASRRSALVFEISSILDQVGDAVAAQSGEGRVRLPSTLYGRVDAVTRSLRPYRYLDEDGELIERPLSPERGQLLTSLFSSRVALGDNIMHMNWRRADLAGARLFGINLHYCDLSQANLSGADLTLADLGSGSFAGADFRDATLKGALLGGSAFAEADLRDADLEGAWGLEEGWLEDSGAIVDRKRWRLVRAADYADPGGGSQGIFMLHAFWDALGGGDQVWVLTAIEG